MVFVRKIMLSKIEIRTNNVLITLKEETGFLL